VIFTSKFIFGLHSCIFYLPWILYLYLKKKIFLKNNERQQLHSMETTLRTFGHGKRKEKIILIFKNDWYSECTSALLSYREMRPRNIHHTTHRFIFQLKHVQFYTNTTLDLPLHLSPSLPSSHLVLASPILVTLGMLRCQQTTDRSTWCV